MTMENTIGGLVFPQGAQVVGGSPGIIYNYMPQQIPNNVLNGKNVVYVPAGFGVSVSNPCGQNFVNRQNNGYPIEQTNFVLPGSVQTTPQVTGLNFPAQVVGRHAAVQTDEVTPENVQGESDDETRKGTLEDCGVLAPENEEVESQLSLFSESMLQVSENEHQQQLQPQIAVVNLKLPNGQVLPGFVESTTDTNVPAAGWTVSPTGSLQGPCCFWPGNMTEMQGFPFPRLQGVQIQGGSGQQVATNAHSPQNLGLASNAMAVSPVPDGRPAPQFFPNTAAYGSLIKVQQLQQDPTDPSTWYVITEGGNPASAEFPTQQSHVIDSTTAFSPGDEALADTPSSSCGVRRRKKRRRLACPCANCVQSRNNGLVKKNHMCTVPGCGKVYGKSGHFRAHLLWHTGGKPYVCDWVPCGKRFNRSDDLQRHYRSHTGERRHECSKCQKRFLRSDHLTKHMRSHLRTKKKKVVNVKRKTVLPKSQLPIALGRNRVPMSK